MKMTISERVRQNAIKVYNHSITLYNEEGEKSGVITGVKLWRDFQPRERFAINDKVKEAGADREILFSGKLEILLIQNEYYCLNKKQFAAMPELIEAAKRFFGDHFLEPKTLYYTETLYSA